MITKTIKTTPRDFFMHLLVFAALYASVVSFLALLFAYINVSFPDRLGFHGDSTGEIITPSSVLIIIFPVLILVSWILGKDLAQNPGKREMKFRKWLIYFTLFVAAVTIIVDLISLVSSFYNGELTTRFLLKMLAVLATAAAIFWYYFWDLKRAAEQKTNKPKLAAWVSSVIVLVAIAAGFFIVGTPAQQRAKRFDQQRISDLQNIQNQLINYWIQKDRLPEESGELSLDQLSGFIWPRDPETEKEYEYTKLTAFSFSICAVFKTENKNEGSPYSGYREFQKPGLLASPTGIIDKPFYRWSHGQGLVCFERTIDPELYKKQP
ncbi:MAG: hypothetical protein G01um101444_17 [Parcubacteria group bacterium Gr01-1014_44]|nr:MAG: hypothetical protein G01um101444_17 [Parcubacteria group bacterium Gr01-1014_44]